MTRPSSIMRTAAPGPGRRPGTKDRGEASVAAIGSADRPKILCLAPESAGQSERLFGRLSAAAAGIVVSEIELAGNEQEDGRR